MSHIRKRQNKAASIRKAVAETLESRRLFASLTIAQENALTGTPQSQWDISGVGDTSIEGFATDISVNRGNTVSFKIDDPSLANYHIDIYRMGYYQGNGARKITTITSAQTLKFDQPNPIVNAQTGLIDAGNWSVAASWAVPSDATSGVYFAKLVREDTGGASHIIFVVRNDQSTSNVIMQTSDTTWEAYNEWGGASLYQGNGPGAAPAQGRAYKVSYNRPFRNRAQSYGYGPQSWVFYNEYPMVRFLEQNGYDVTYQAGVDTDRFGSLIQNHQVFVSAGHDEYWSGGQRAAVESARDAGTDLAFFSGNLMYWKTRYESSIDGSGTPYRTLVCYKESLPGAKIDPTPTWTGLWRDARFSPPSDGGRPENATTGGFGLVDRGPNDIGTPITVPSWAGKFRLWRGTTLTNLANGASANVGDSVLGYEWDIDADNGFRPAGLIDLSSTTQSATELLSYYGTTTAPGIATHNLVMYRAPSGALVFNAATVQWAWGLDSNHDGRSATGAVPPADVRMQQATINLFADMGVQPTTLKAGLIAASQSSDAAKPGVTINTPPNGVIIVSGGFATISGTATDTGGGLVAGIEVSIDGGATWHPATGRETWTYSWNPTQFGNIAVRVRATDDSANIGTPVAAAMVVQQGDGSTSIWGDAAIPGTLNDADAQPIEVGVKFKSDVAGYITGIRFYKGTQNTGTHIGHLWTASGSLLGTATFNAESSSGWQTVTFSSPISILANTTYVASYHTDTGHYSSDGGYFLSTGVDHAPLHALSNTSSGGNGVYRYGATGFPDDTFNGSNYWVDVVFNTTASGNDTTPPVVIAQSPSAGSSGISLTTSIRATFSESIQASSLIFQLKAPNGAIIPANVVYDDSIDTATLTPTSPLSTATTYTVTVSGARDTSGNVMTSTVTWTFTTVNSATVSSIWQSSATPTLINANDATAYELGVKFRSDVLGWATGILFYKGSLNTGTHTGTLWTASGSALTTVTFTNETASGWQSATFSQPVQIQPNTTYIASYHTNVGFYSADLDYFTGRGFDNGPLHALADGVDGGNGVFADSTTTVFPNETYRGANYWVDVQFTTSSQSDTTPPTITTRSPAPGATGVSRTTAISVTFSEDIVPSSLALSLQDPSSNVVTANVTYNSATRTATLMPTSSLAATTLYTVSVSGARDAAGNVMAGPITWTFTTQAAADTTAPTVTSRTPAANATGVARNTAVSATFSEDIQQATLSFVLRDASNNVVASTVSYNAATRVATLTPTTLLNASATYTVTVSGAKDVAGNTMTATSWSFTTVALDTTRPTIIARSPAANATNVSRAVHPTITFSEAMLGSSITLNNIQLKRRNANVGRTISYDATTHVVTITPSATLASLTAYTITIVGGSAGVKDLAGNALVATTSWTFTTGSATTLAPNGEPIPMPPIKDSPQPLDTAFGDTLPGFRPSNSKLDGDGGTDPLPKII